MDTTKPETVTNVDDQKVENDVLKITDAERETDKEEEESSSENGPGAEQAVQSKTEPNGVPSKVEDKKRPYDYNQMLDEIKKQKTHDLYCPNCTGKITQTAKLFVKGEETFPYNKERFILWFTIVISFKYPFIYLPWFYSNSPDSSHPTPGVPTPGVTTPSVPTPSVTTPSVTTPSVATPTVVVDRTTKKHIPDWLRFLLVVVLLVLSAIVLWVPPSPPPLHTNGDITNSTPGLEKTPENVTDINGHPKPNGADDTPATPPTENKGGWIPLPKVFSVISFLLLAILALCWPSISWNKKTKPAEDKYKPETPEDNKDKEDDGLITPEKIPPTPMRAKITEILRKYIVVPIQNVLLTEVDILKSIVYGGLIESITSFGVVSSAAGSGTSTLNVLALGIANLFSGLFLIIYNLYGLIKNRPRFEGPNNDHMANQELVDPYKELLGKRDNIILHCFVVVVSFLFFAVIPPIFYCFSFIRTDKGHYEQAAVFVTASVLCVVSLSFAKAYAFTKNKLNTVAVFTGIAIVASAFSYISSQYAIYLLEKYDFHKLASEYLTE